jgi:predicted lactoylglutathione lyase
MIAHALTPILNVSSFQQSVAWFEKIGWKSSWSWGDPPSFGGVTSGACQIFLCQGGQGGRGASPIKNTFGPDGDQTADKGVWMSLWVDDVDEVYRQCMEQGLDVAFPPTDMEWNVREMHLRHPDGHVFRISRSLEKE